MVGVIPFRRPPIERHPDGTENDDERPDGGDEHPLTPVVHMPLSSAPPRESDHPHLASDLHGVITAPCVPTRPARARRTRRRPFRLASSRRAAPHIATPLVDDR